MIYFLIVLLFALPFITNTVQKVSSSKNKWLHPLFFLVFSLAIFQISLSWIPLFEIRNYYLFEALTYVVFLSIVVFSAIYFTVLVVRNKTKISFSEFLLANKTSFACAGILLVQLTIFVAIPQIGNYSDTNAYIAISSNFKGNGYFGFNPSSDLPIFYRLPVGYFLNSVFSVNNDYETAYRLLWPLTIIFVFFWTFQYFVYERLTQWTSKFKFLYLIFINSMYLVLSLISAYTLTPGNLEIQALFIFLSLVLFMTKDARYNIILVFSFCTFSSTALMISPTVLIVLFVVLLFRARRYEFLYSFFAGLSLMFLGLTILLYDSLYQTLAFYMLGSSIVTLIISWSLIKILRMKNIFFYAPVLPLSWISCWNDSAPLHAVKGFFSSKSEAIKKRNIAMLVLYAVTAVAIILISALWAFNLVPLNSFLIYPSLVFSLLFLAYSIYLLITRNRILELTKWLLLFNIGFILTCIVLAPIDLFNHNASSWRIVLGTVTIGFYCSYVGLGAIFIGNIFSDHINEIDHVRIGNVIKFKRLVIFNYAIPSVMLIGSLTGTTASWIIRLSNVKKIINPDNAQITNKNISITNDDKLILQHLNTLNSKKEETLDANTLLHTRENISASTIDKQNKFLFSYYSDINLTSYLNNCYVFSYGDFWKANVQNDFISSDAWLHVVENNPINRLMYYEKDNAITNINYIIEQSIWNMDKLPIESPSIRATINQNTPNIPIKEDQISVDGSADLIILNKHSSYYQDLEIVKNCSSNPGQTYMLNNAKGYKLLKETEGIAYFIDTNKILDLTKVLA